MLRNEVLGRNIRLVDIHAAFVRHANMAGLYSTGGINSNDSGYELIA